LKNNIATSPYERMTKKKNEDEVSKKDFREDSEEKSLQKV